MEKLRSIAACALALCLAAAPAAAADETSLAESFRSAKALMLNGRPAEARAILRQLDDRYPDRKSVV